MTDNKELKTSELFWLFVVNIATVGLWFVHPSLVFMTQIAFFVIGISNDQKKWRIGFFMPFFLCVLIYSIFESINDFLDDTDFSKMYSKRFNKSEFQVVQKYLKHKAGYYDNKDKSKSEKILIVLDIIEKEDID